MSGCRGCRVCRGCRSVEGSDTVDTVDNIRASRMSTLVDTSVGSVEGVSRGCRLTPVSTVSTVSRVCRESVEGVEPGLKSDSRSRTPTRGPLSAIGGIARRCYCHPPAWDEASGGVATPSIAGVCTGPRHTYRFCCLPAGTGCRVRGAPRLPPVFPPATPASRSYRPRHRRQSPSAPLLRCVPAAPPGAETAAVAAIV